MPTMAQVQSPTLESLPKQFVTAMRTLFDIMDDKRTGFVKFSDIQERWQDDGTKGLPKGVIESLQKVTPPNGLLSFERFCGGLKICLLRNQIDTSNSQSKPMRTISTNSQPIRPPSAPLLDIDSSKPSWSSTSSSVRTNVILPQQRTLSMPQLHDRKDTVHPVLSDIRNFENKISSNTNPPPLYGPPKPPRTAAGLERAMLAANSERNMDKAEIRSALQNWQLGVLKNDYDSAKINSTENRLCCAVQSVAMRNGRGSADGKPSGHLDQLGIPHKKTVSRRREPRRHTLQNGIDYNMLKRMKQIEQEKDVLMQGLQAVERARDWYLKQVAIVQEKMKYLGRMGSHMEQLTEAQQERLELQRARVFEVNRHLAMLTHSWERGGLPLHMNLAVHQTHDQDLVTRLKRQNHLLTEEVSKKSDRITSLEREKASLIRELFQYRSQPRRSGEVEDNTVFM